jgi:uncharacterized membrane protein
MFKKIKHIFETKMYLISILPYLFLIRFNSGKTWGINKSIGWAFDVSDLRDYIVFIIIGFALGFCILYFLKAKTNWLLSLFFFLLISISSLMQNGHRTIQFIDYTLILSILLFIILFIQSLFSRIKSIKKPS